MEYTEMICQLNDYPTATVLAAAMDTPTSDPAYDLLWLDLANRLQTKAAIILQYISERNPEVLN